MSDPTAALPLRRRQRQTERAVDLMHRAIAPDLGAIVRRCAESTPDGDRITPLGRTRILAELDTLLDPIYGDTRGAESALETLTVAESTAARLAALGTAVSDIRRRLPGRRGAALRQAMGDGTAEERT